ncbi:MAG: hypothetical protein LIP02_08815 [Bacteroidales bacterium]|nr:hypothetical protein [Bacteroidales bacterium]
MKENDIPSIPQGEARDLFGEIADIAQRSREWAAANPARGLVLAFRHEDGLCGVAIGNDIECNYGALLSAVVADPRVLETFAHTLLTLISEGACHMRSQFPTPMLGIEDDGEKGGER